MSKIRKCKAVKATIVEIESCECESGYVICYDHFDAMDDLRAERNNIGWSVSSQDVRDKVESYAMQSGGYVEDDLFGAPVVKCYRAWYNYKLKIKYVDKSRTQHFQSVRLETERKLKENSLLCLRYYVDAPEEIESVTDDWVLRQVLFSMCIFGLIIIVVFFLVIGNSKKL